MADDSGPSTDGPVNLLALDGGGIRGLSELLILDEAMKRIQHDLKLDELPRPCDYFHLIGGTSTGGLIALLLGRFRMPTDEALRIYNEIAGSIFCKGNKKRSFQDGTFKATTLENTVRTLVTKRNVGSSMLDSTGVPEMGRAFVCAMSAKNMEHPRLFRTYHVRENAGVNCEIWEAVRATTAAPTFFKRVTIGEEGQVKEEFIDGGVRCNNPADEVLEEARRVFGDQRILNCLVSIGTGHPGVIGLSKPDEFQRLLPTELITALKQIATDCEQKSEELSARFQNIIGLYFRFNVPHGLGQVSLEEWKKMPDVQAHTMVYLRKHDVSRCIDELVNLLKHPRKEGGYALGSTRGIPLKSHPRSTPRVSIRSKPGTSPIFTGRERILTRLDEFFDARSGQSPQRKEFLLYGMGGAGKTQVSLKFAERNIHRFKYVFWIDGSSIATIEQCFKDIAAKNCPDVSDAEASVQSALWWLGSLTEEWLLLFDNVESFKAASEALPENKGNIIYTSRNPEGCLSLPKGAYYEVSEMEEEESLQLLARARGLSETRHQEEAYAKSIVVELGHLPLAIDQAGAYMATRSCGAQDYLRRFNRKRAELMQNQSYKRASSHDQAVYATWDVSYTALEQARENETDVEQRKAAQAAVHIQGVFAMLHREDIMKEIFRRAAESGKFQQEPSETIEQKQAQHYAELAAMLLPLNEESIWDPELFERGVRELLKLSLVRQYDLGTAFYMHPLVHFWAQDRLAPLYREYYQRSAREVLSASVVWNFTSDDYSFRRRLLPHVVKCQQTKGLCPKTLLDANTAANFALVFSEAGSWDDSEKLEVQVMETRKRVLGQEHPSTLTSMANLASTYRNQGRWKEAEELDVQVMETRKRMLGQEHPGTLTSMANLASTYLNQGRWKEAKELTVSPKYQILAAPMSSSASTAEPVQAESIFSSVVQSTDPTTVEIQDTGLANETAEKMTDDVDSIYSVESDMEADSGYINGVAQIIFQQLQGNFLDITSFKPVLIVAERALEAFTSKLGHELDCKQAQEARVFIKKHRKQIKDSLERIGYRHLESIPQDNTTDREPDEVSRRDVLGWLKGTNPGDEHPNKDPKDKHPDNDPEDDPEDKHLDNDSEDDPDFVEQDIEKDGEEDGQHYEQVRLEYRELIDSGAFRWLIMRLKREIFMTAPTTDHASSIAEDILRKLVSKGKVSRKNPVESHRAVFTVDWNPLAFLEEQDYEEEWSEALAGAITLTGCASFAQALTCAEYMRQTWPCSGLSTLHAFQHIVKRSQDGHKTQEDADKPELSAFMHEGKVKVDMKGVAYTIAEIAEQLAWLGSALRSSPYENGVAVCVPQIDIDYATSSEDTCCKTEIHCTLKFHIEPQAEGPLDQKCVCWHKLFRNPVIVRGFPVPRQVCRTLGLDIPLNIMARLAQARRVTKFDNKLYAKGFSTMLLATKYNKDEGLLFWHLFYNEDGSHISYLDVRVKATEKIVADRISFQELENSRHILGWCSTVQSRAGAHDSEYHIRSSGRREPHAGCRVEKFSITGGKIVNFGLSGAIADKDVPIHLNRNGSYLEMIKAIFSKFVILYDVDEKRAWLVNGASALLHLVRSSLEDDRQSVIGSKLLFKPEELQRAKTEYTPESAVDVLTNEENMVLEIFPHKPEFSEEFTSGAFDRPDTVRKRKRTCVLLQDRVEQVSHFLEQILIYQTDKAANPGVEFKGRPRNYLEGFEFNAVAKGSDPIVLKITALRSTGKCWIDFARAINAVALFGRGFGDIIRPKENGETCHSWISMPKGKDYLAICVPDLRRIIDDHGDMEGTSVRIVDDIYWHNPDKIFESCLCKGKSVKNTCARAQVLLPSKFDPRRLTNRVVRPNSWEDSFQGAIIFGHNRRFPLKWPDEPDRDPEEAQSEEADEEHLRSGIKNLSSTGSSDPRERGVSTSSVPQDQPSTDHSGELTSNTTIQSPSRQEGSVRSGIAEIMASDSGVQRPVGRGPGRRKILKDYLRGLFRTTEK